MDNLILTDLFDRETGTISKADAHRLGRLHRAFSVFIVHDGRMLLQKRHRDKYHSGGLWANACCSHPRHGETLENAVQRRLRDELGISCPVEEVFSFVYFSRYAKDLFEYEYDHVFLADYSGECDVNPAEIEALEWVALTDLEHRMLTDPCRFTSWFMIAAPRVLRLLTDKNTAGQMS